MIILGTNSIKETGYNVDNSVRFNRGDSAYLQKSASAGNRKTFTFSTWLKRGNLTYGYATFFSSDQAATNSFRVTFDDDDGSNDDRLMVYYFTGSHQLKFITNREFRDVSAWYHIVIAVDTTQSTEGNRFKIYVNGTQETSFSTASYPSQNLDTSVNQSGAPTRVGAGTSLYFDGYMCETVLVDGSQLAADSFGEFDSDSPTIWKPIDVSGLTFGTNGFYLDYKDSSNLGNDANGGTDLTATNLAATDQSLDTCTNNFCTMNPLTKTSATLSEGNLKQATAGNSSVATFGVSAGTWYFEQKILGGVNEAHLGFALDEAGIFSDAVTGSTVRGAGYVSLYSYDGKIYNESSATSSFATFAANDIVGFALDVDNGNVYLYQNGSALNSGNAVVSGKTGKTWFPFGNFDAGDVTGIEHNFGGCPSFSISSAQNDANGFGTFEYAPKSGYLALCTKNLGSDGG